jgi:hypothetical protein
MVALHQAFFEPMILADSLESEYPWGCLSEHHLLAILPIGG